MLQSASKLLPIAFFFLVLFVYTKVVGPIPFSASSVSTTKTGTFNVSGQGTIERIDRKLDIVTANEVEYGKRLMDIEAVPAVALQIQK